MKRISVLAFLALLSWALTGCTAKEPAQPLCRVVTGIQVTAAQDGNITHHSYTQPKQLEAVLNYLRLLDPYVSTAIQPDTFRTNAFRIVVSYSDGASTTYHQIYNEYLQTDGGTWKRIHTGYASRLPELLQKLSGNAV